MRINFHNFSIPNWLSMILGMIGTVMQLSVIRSHAWIVVERFEPPYCRSWKPKVLFYDPQCDMRYSQKDEVVRAGLWTVCHKFPHVVPKDHTDPYCSDFADDAYPEMWLTVAQIQCLLSISLAALGLLVLTLEFLQRILNLKLNIPWTGSNLLVLGGMVGVIAASYYHFRMKKEFLVYYNPSLIFDTKHWPFHVFLDGAIINLTAGILYERRAKRKRFIRIV